MAFDIKSLANQLKSSGQLTDFLESLGVTSSLFNCTTDRYLPNDGVVSGNIYRRQMLLSEKFSVFEGHRHNFDHVTYIIRGKVFAKYWDTDEDGNKIVESEMSIEYSAPSAILIHKNKSHQFMALSDDVIAECIYAIRDESGAITTAFNGSMYPYL